MNFFFSFLGEPITYTGDPLEDLTLIRFLDRYVFKNPKKLDDKKVQRKNDPLAQRAGYTPKGIRSLPVDSMAYLNEAEERIPVDEVFLYRYLKRRNEMKQRVKQEIDDDDEDVESVNSEEFNDMLDHMGSGQDFDDLDIAANIVPGKKKSNIIHHIKYTFLSLASLKGNKRNIRLNIYLQYIPHTHNYRNYFYSFFIIFRRQDK